MTSSRLSAFLRSQWTVAIGSGVLLLLLPGIWSAIAKINFQVAYLATVGWIWAHLLDFRAPVWSIIIAVTACMAIIGTVRRVRKNAKPAISTSGGAASDNLERPDHFGYVKDEVRHWTFRWTYLQGDQGMPPTIVNLHAVCAECDSPLLREKPNHITGDVPGMYCAVCRKTYPLFDESTDSGEIGTIVRHRIRTGQYRTSKYLNG